MANSNIQTGKVKTGVATVTIASSGTESTAIDCGAATVVGIHLPAAFTGTSVSFKAAEAAGDTFDPVYDSSGSLISATVAADRYVKLDPTLLAGIRHLKLLSDATEGAARTVGLSLRDIG